MDSANAAGSPPGARPVRAPRGTGLSCRGWPQEAAMRMLMNNLDPEVAEHPDQLVVYGGARRAPRCSARYGGIVSTLNTLAGGATLPVPSGQSGGGQRPHRWAPR